MTLRWSAPWPPPAARAVLGDDGRAIDGGAGAFPAYFLKSFAYAGVAVVAFTARRRSS